VLKDEHWQRLATAIEQKLIGALRQHLEQQQAQLAADDYVHYTHRLLQALEIKPHTHLPEDVLGILRDLVPLPRLQPDAQVGYCTLTDLLTEPLILLANQSEWHFIAESLEVYRAIERDLGHVPPVLLHQGQYREGINLAIDRLFMRRGIIICSAPGLVLYVLQDSEGILASHPAGLFRMSKRYGERWTYNLHEPASQHTLLCAHHSGSVVRYGRFLLWNAGHPLFAPLLEDDQARDEHCKELLYEFEESSGNIMSRLKDDPDFDVGYDASGKRVKLPFQSNVLMVGVFRRVPWLLGAFQQAMQEHWQRMQEAGVVAVDAPFPGLSEHDFPWFWSREQWEK
jgi:hypothetical protein